MFSAPSLVVLQSLPDSNWWLEERNFFILFSFVSRKKGPKEEGRNVITISLKCHANNCCCAAPEPIPVVNDTMRHLILLIISKMVFPNRLLSSLFFYPDVMGGKWFMVNYNRVAEAAALTDGVSAQRLTTARYCAMQILRQAKLHSSPHAMKMYSFWVFFVVALFSGVAW